MKVGKQICIVTQTMGSYSFYFNEIVTLSCDQEWKNIFMQLKLAVQGVERWSFVVLCKCFIIELRFQL